ncbi:RING finger protein, host range [Eptesipox virus]|uniref:RING finger protein, host range n=1 Tax=Eptesipox virus TaxID=1329402 RepID=A0A220T6M0_9POXV|nr:RING finger protein, host range [Eptesipox virus]ASK51360.1 RING finger protein, host range [Eptesipox virus]WAH71118.1 RING finger protein, host range [Eptesipox virus]
MDDITNNLETLSLDDIFTNKFNFTELKNSSIFDQKDYTYIFDVENNLISYDTQCGNYTFLQFCNYIIIIDKSTLYINASKLCTNVNKLFCRWKQTILGKQSIDNIVTNELIDRDNLFIRIYKSKQTLEYYGIFVYPKLIYYITRWISVNYCNIILTMLFNYYNNLQYNIMIPPYSYYNVNIPHFIPIAILKQYNNNKDYSINMIFTAICEKNDMYQKLKYKNFNMINLFETKFNKFVDVECSICLEKVYDKSIDLKYFGILPICSHIFCFQCICTWKKNKNTCPICRKKINIIIKCKYL